MKKVLGLAVLLASSHVAAEDQVDAVINRFAAEVLEARAALDKVGDCGELAGLPGGRGCLQQQMAAACPKLSKAAHTISKIEGYGVDSAIMRMLRAAVHCTDALAATTKGDLDAAAESVRAMEADLMDAGRALTE